MREPYDEFQYIVPPWTEVALQPECLPRYELDEYFAQFKRNGSRSVVFVPPDRKRFFTYRSRLVPAAWNRHREPHRKWQFTDQTWEIFRSLKGNKWCVIDAELLEHQTAHIKHTHYIFDVLVWNGVRMTGTTYGERYNLLLDIWPRRSAEFGHYVLDQHTWLARCYVRDFVPLFRSLTAPEDEGLVLKNPEGVYRGEDANSWMVKVRRLKEPAKRKRR